MPIGGKKLPMTEILFRIAESDIQSGLNLLPSQVAIRLDQRLEPEQRLWLQELLETAALIENTYWNFGYGYSFDIMMIELKNSLGWRIVDPAACPSGKTIDNVTRACVEIPPTTKACPSGTTLDPVSMTCVAKSSQASFLSGKTLTYLLFGGILLLILMGRK